MENARQANYTCIDVCLLIVYSNYYSFLTYNHQAQENMEFLGPTPVANTGPKRRGRWAQPGVELSVRSMLDLRQLETLAPSPRGPSQDSLAVSPSGPGKHGSQPPELSCDSQVS